MKQPTALLKVAVVASSVLLVCGFIAYRVGAFDRFFRSGTPTANPGSGQTAGENLSGGAMPPAPTFFSSTKVDVISNAPRGTPDLFAPPHTATKPDPFIPWSYKWAPIVPPNNILAPATPQQPPPNTAPPKPIIMGGTKSPVPSILIPAPTAPTAPSQSSKPEK